jgi:hypothetical protein
MTPGVRGGLTVDHLDLDPIELLESLSSQAERVQKAREMGLWDYVAAIEGWDTDFDYEWSCGHGRGA